MFFGEGSRHGKGEELSQAKVLIENGFDNEHIYKQTGWFKGLEGKWRTELFDGDLELSDDFLRYLRCGSSKRMDVNNVIFQKSDNDKNMVDVILSKGDDEPSKSVYLMGVPVEELPLHVPGHIAEKITTSVKENPNRQTFEESFDFDGVPKTFPLPMVFKHHPIIHAHHEFWNTFVSLNTMASLAHATKINGSHCIHMNPHKCAGLDAETATKILVHETQHVVQAIEGFATGGSIENFFNIDRVEQYRSSTMKEINKVLSDNPVFAEKFRAVKYEYHDLKDKYPDEDGEVEWDNVPDALSESYFEMRDEIYESFDEELSAYESGFYQLAFNESHISERDRLLTKRSQYFQLAGEQESYDAEDRFTLNRSERASTIPTLAKNDATGIVFKGEEILDYTWKETKSREEKTHIHITPNSDTFSTISIGDKAGLEDIIPMFSTTMLRVYGELSKELSEDNQLTKDFNVITAWLGVTPNEFQNMDYLKRERLEKKFADGFVNHLRKPNEPTPLENVFGVIRKWLNISLSKLGGANVVIDVPEDMKGVYQRLTDTAPKKVDANSDFQTKLNEALQHSTNEVIDVQMALSSIVDSGYSSIAEASGIEPLIIQERFNVETMKKGTRIRPKSVTL